jgi:predicted DCC family thiol-disulfide oxidoreductase YuxK
MREIALYDAECPFCRASVALLLAWDRDRQLEPVALQTERALELLPGMDEEERMESWHLVAADGVVRSGGTAFPPALRLLPGGEPFARLAEISPRFTEAAYEWVSRHRATFAHWLPDRLRTRADRLILERTRPPQPVEGRRQAQ